MGDGAPGNPAGKKTLAPVLLIHPRDRSVFPTLTTRETRELVQGIDKQSKCTLVQKCETRE